MAGIMIAMAAWMKVLIAARVPMVAGVAGVAGVPAPQIPGAQPGKKPRMHIAIILILLVEGAIVLAPLERVALIPR